MKDTILYDRLNISPDASVEEIKKAGRKMSMKWHPDKNINNREEAEQRFKEVREAVEILTSDKREAYDKYGIDFEKQQNEPSFYPFHKQETDEHAVHHLLCSLEQIAKEEVITFNYSRKTVCEKCDGEGGKKEVTCRRCNGRGMELRVIQMGPITQQMMGPCGNCKGKGKEIVDKCGVCTGNGFIVKQELASIKLQNGLENNMKIKVDGKGHQFKTRTTDLIVVIEEEPHEAFTRKGENVYVDIELTLYEALFGFRKIVYHLDGRILRVSHIGATDYNTLRKIEKEGFSNLRKGGVKGDLYLNFIFKLPEISDVSQITPPSQYDEDKVESSLVIDVEMIDATHEPDTENIQTENMENPQQCRPM
jgi:DnaJ-class molecular chaperone